MFYRLRVHALTVILATTVHVRAAPTAATGVDDATLENLTFFSQFATAAYCTQNIVNDMADVPIGCIPGANCENVTADGVRSLVQFTGRADLNALADISGFVGIDNVRRLIVVAFRGTSGFRNMIADLRLLQTPTNLCPNCWANIGFWQGYTLVQTRILDAVKRTFKTNPGYQVIVTGHSLGGALANLAAADLRKQTKPSYGLVDLYTYGAPRAGNRHLAAYITSQTPPRGRVFRVTHARDQVPRVPPNALGFSHPYPQYFIGSNNTAMVQKSDIKISNKCCNQGDDVKLFHDGPKIDLGAHLHYFKEIAACMPNGMNRPPISDITMDGATPSDLAMAANETTPNNSTGP